MALIPRAMRKLGRKLKPSQKRPSRTASAIGELQRGAPAQQAQTESQMRAASSKQQQLYGTSGRTDVAAGREAQLGRDIRQRQRVIGEQAREKGIRYGMEHAALRSRLKTARVGRQIGRHQRDILKAQAAEMQPAKKRVPRAIRRKNATQGTYLPGHPKYGSVADRLRALRSQQGILQAR